MSHTIISILAITTVKRTYHLQYANVYKKWHVLQD